MLLAAVTREGLLVMTTGTLDCAETDAELAVVLGHEVAHVLANHYGERARLLLFHSDLLLPLVGFALVAKHHLGSSPAFRFIRALVAVPTIWSVLKCSAASQTMEVEADLVGMHLMAAAGYDPAAAASLFQNVKSKQEKSLGRIKMPPPESLKRLVSTHPPVSPRNLQFASTIVSERPTDEAPVR